MIRLQEFFEYLTQLLPSDKIADGCPNGLQVEGKASIKRAATAVSANLATIESAAERGVDALIVHHGLFWQRDSYVIEGIKRKKIKLLLEHEISLFAYHLPLDLHQEIGNNWLAAKELGWGDLQPFGYMNGIPIGVQGKLPAVSRQDFQAQLERYYDHPAASALGGKELVSSAALISGGAYKSLSDAVQAGVDCFITGNFDEPAWNQAFEEKINFFALGHSATERVGPKALGQRIKKDLGLACEFIDIPNPF
jgi:dinuclear metal center YbgI/SA1388 family protein